MNPDPSHHNENPPQLFSQHLHLASSMPSYSPPPPPMADSSSNRPDRHLSASLSTPQTSVMLPEFDSNIKTPLCPSTDRPVTASVLSTSSDSSSCSSNSLSASLYTSNPTSQGSSDSDLPEKHTPFQPDTFNAQSHNVHLESSLLPRPVSPFHVSRPPLRQRSFRTLISQPTAMQSCIIPSYDTTSYPSPDPPVILPTENNTIMNQSSFLSQAPYFPFLSHAPPPENSWIEVETLQHEYNLHVRLPGFTREGITLATKKRRILHVVANKWENGGGK